MNIVFVSNFLNHHQKPFVYALNGIDGVKCTFVSLEKMPDERKQLGYGGEEDGYVLQCSEDIRKAEDAVGSCDILISGGVREDFIKIANKKNIPVFVFSERLFKDKKGSIKNKLRIVKYGAYRPLLKNAYLLCASGFAYGDYLKCALFKNRAYKWGYFPDLKRYDDIDGLIASKKQGSILWCGRFLSLKHPDDALKAFKLLVDDGYDITLDYIGIGEESEKIKALVRDNNLSGRVRFCGAMTPDRVRLRMEKADIFLFTSDRREGWGAVLNEAMNSACSIVTSDAPGSVPILFSNGENGLVYSSGNVDELYKKIKFLLDNPGDSSKMKKNAYSTIEEMWNPNTAATRFAKLSENILRGDKNPDIFKSGPCSKAEIIEY